MSTTENVIMRRPNVTDSLTVQKKMISVGVNLASGTCSVCGEPLTPHPYKNAKVSHMTCAMEECREARELLLSKQKLNKKN